MNAAATLPAPLDVRLMNGTATVLFIGVALAVLWAGGHWLLRLPAFAVARIVVEGDLAHTSPLSLRANVAPQLAGNFLTLDLQAARRAFEQVPWVRSAQVRREFPSGLRVLLQEHQAAAHWGAEGSGMLVDRFGEVFEAESDELDDNGLPRLIGTPERAPEMLRMAQLLVPLLAPLGTPLDTLTLTPHGGWRVLLDSGALLELGGGAQDEVLRRVRRLVTTLPQVAQQQGGRSAAALEYADLRHSGGYALRLRGVTTVSAEEAARHNNKAGRAAPRTAPASAAARRATQNH
ncbi:cell division protein FtsQ [Oryzisolibacter propanilivorax]|uniref:Cell division protein FtsQ n=1 Tax=Oryzisolibacter propanilivorax TaxID=1527607 RepID=A0A1G9RPZ2_9BURK|nr:cell division protein FtsQ/DivIB [Oryzisolibacter propanilivorax]SDM25251.1 cell division protein FtsQ [Oryzisolibacter propanilivorax]